MREVGEVHDRTDTIGAADHRVLIVSNDFYRDDTGMVVVCPVLDDEAGMGEPMQVRMRIAGEPRLVLCGHLFRMPAAGLGDPPVDRVEGAALEYIRKQLRGIFS